MEEILTVKNLKKDSILNDISFQVEKGEMVAIMGPSGSGKSTLLYQLSGMDHPSEGEVILSGVSLTGRREEELAALRLNRMGFVFQQMNMLKNLTILDNILLPAYQGSRQRLKGKENRKAQREQAQCYALELMRKMGIEELANRRITEVSGGQLQRACICRSMINEPEILFADEPTGALNQGAAVEVMEELARLNGEGMTILMVTHDSKIAGWCDRILYLLDGRLEGELKLGKQAPELARQREEQVRNWLIRMGW